MKVFLNNVFNIKLIISAINLVLVDTLYFGGDRSIYSQYEALTEFSELQNECGEFLAKFSEYENGVNTRFLISFSIVPKSIDSNNLEASNLFSVFTCEFEFSDDKLIEGTLEVYILVSEFISCYDDMKNGFIVSKYDGLLYHNYVLISIKEL